MLARQAAAIHELSGGRLVVALGAGWNEPEFRAFGLPFDRRVARFEEAFEIIRRLLAGEQVTFRGAFHEVDDAVLLPPPKRRPRLMVGANGPRLLAATLPHVDAWNTWYTSYGNTVDGIRRAQRRDRRAADARRSRPGRDRAQRLRVRGGRAGRRAALGRRARFPASVSVEHLDALADAGADEAILVVDPITEASIRSLRTALPSG